MFVTDCGSHVVWPVLTEVRLTIATREPGGKNAVPPRHSVLLPNLLTQQMAIAIGAVNPRKPQGFDSRAESPLQHLLLSTELIHSECSRQIDAQSAKGWQR